jgi:hypothetical protein
MQVKWALSALSDVVMTYVNMCISIDVGKTLGSAPFIDEAAAAMPVSFL